MPLLLLISNQINLLIMKVDKEKLKINSSTLSKELQAYHPEKNDIILCNHCKRTSSNGIRCMGICVADNDY